MTVERIPIINGADIFTLDASSKPSDQARLLLASIRRYMQVVRDIRAACASWGFFQLHNHGLSAEYLQSAQEAMHTFFAMPLPLKLTAKRSEDNPRGYFNDEFTKEKLDQKEGFDFGSPNAMHDAETSRALDGFDRWPDCDAATKETLLSLYSEVESLARRLLEALSIGLNLSIEGLHALFSKDTSFLRLNHYPVVEQEPGSLGINPHKDAGFLTVLIPDGVAGLEVWKDGVWHGLVPEPGAIVINIGDMAQVLTNDSYRASLHRVRAQHKTSRYSAAFFFNPAHDAVIKPLDTCIESEEGPHYRPISWREFRSQRFAGDFAAQGEEIQIEHYRVSKPGS